MGSGEEEEFYHGPREPYEPHEREDWGVEIMRKRPGNFCMIELQFFDWNFATLYYTSFLQFYCIKRLFNGMITFRGTK